MSSQTTTATISVGTSAQYIAPSYLTRQGYYVTVFYHLNSCTATDTSVTMTGYAGVKIGTGSLNMSKSTATVTVSSSGQTTQTLTQSVKNPGSSTPYYQTYVSSFSYTWSKGTSATTKTVTVGLTFSSSSYFKDDDATITLTVNVPAKTSYTVAYNANGGSGAPASQTKWYGTTLTLSATKPTRTGYTFKGWATSSSGSVAYQPSASYTANAAVTLYAVWQINTWTVSYNANGGSGSIANQTKTYGVNLTLSNGAGYTRSLYTLDHWNTKADNSGTTYAKSATYTGNAALTLYAIWALAYVKPTISNFVCYRVASSGSTTATDDGEVIYISFDWAGGQLGGNTVNPTITVTIGGATVYNPTTQSTGTGTFTQWYDNSGNGYNKDSSYAVSAKVYDTNYPTGVTKTATIQTAIYLIDAIGSGANVYAGVMHTAVSGRPLSLPETYVDTRVNVPTPNMDYTVTSLPASVYQQLVMGVDSSGLRTGQVELAKLADGKHVASLVSTRRSSDNTTYIYNHLNLFIDNDGTRTASFDASSVSINSLMLGGHSSAVGTVEFANSSQNVTLSSGTSYQSLSTSAKLTLSAGSWIISGTAFFASNATGVRSARFYAGTTAYTQSTVIVPAASGVQTAITTTLIIIPTASIDVYMQAYQNSGSNLAASSYMRAMRIA